MKNIYENKKIFKELKDHLLRKFENDEVEKVYEIAPAKYKEIVEKYPVSSPKEKYHTNKIFPLLGMYNALKEVLSTSGTQELENFMHEFYTNAGKKLNNLLNLPNFNKLFIRIAKKKITKNYTEEAGFTAKNVDTLKGEYKVEIHRCPYLKYCEQEGAKEFAKAFCQADDDLYGNLEKIQFIRENTLARGGEKCDFFFQIRDGIPKIDEPKIISGVTK